MQFRYFPHILLFIGMVFFLIRGIIIIGEREFRMPFTWNRQVVGRSAIWVGSLQVLIGVICGLDLLAILFFKIDLTAWFMALLTQMK